MNLINVYSTVQKLYDQHQFIVTVWKMATAT